MSIGVDRNISERKTYILLEQIKDSSQAAFEEFFNIYQPAVFRFLFRFTGDKDVAEDLTQDTFIKFWYMREKIDLVLSPTAYLFKIARNSAINNITRSRLNEDFDVDQQSNGDPQMEYEFSFLMDDFQKAINELPERCRAVFILSRYENLSYLEISQALDISLQTVKNQMNKAISVLRVKLSAYQN